jgi:hypothetical protein
MRRSAVPLALAVLAALACDRPATAPAVAVLDAVAAPSSDGAAVLTVSQRFPLELEQFVPCAAGGLGETVALSGELHELFHVTISLGGNVVVKTFDNPQGVTGVGLTTGAQYQATGVTQEIFSLRVGATDTFVNEFHVIGQGPDNNFVVREVLHLTINANGELTAQIDNFSVECR